MENKISTGLFIVLVIILAVLFQRVKYTERPTPYKDLRDYYLNNTASGPDYPKIAYDKSQYITLEEQIRIEYVIEQYLQKREDYDSAKKIMNSALKGGLRGAVLGALYNGIDGLMVGGSVWFVVGGILRAMKIG
jgi:hypothetical protein